MSIRWAGHRFDADVRVVDVVNVDSDDLGPLSGLASLEELRVRWTNPHEQPIRLPTTLEPLRHLRELRVVSLPGWQVADLTPLAELTALEVLDLRDSRVGSLTPVHHLPALRHVDVRGSSASRADVEALRSARPDVEVSW